MLRIITHPGNAGLIDQFKADASHQKQRQGISIISLSAIDVLFDFRVPEKIWTGAWKRLDKCHFTSYDLENPQDWEIYFHFVEKVMRPHFILTENQSAFVLDAHSHKPVRL
jgi:hypothetical protein